MPGAFIVRPARAEDGAAVVALLAKARLEAEFVPEQFVVGELDGAPVAAARLKPLADGTHEIASVVVRGDMRGRRYGEQVVTRALAGARGPVHAIALAPGFFARLGFARVENLPAALREKMDGMCASSGAVPMVWAPALAP